jgi:uncharacterized protein (DUF433 family)
MINPIIIQLANITSLYIFLYTQTIHDKESDMNARISIDANICHGKPVIKGTRVLVSNILSSLAAGESIEEIIKDYPNIMRNDIIAALEFGSQLSTFETIPYEAEVL